VSLLSVLSPRRGAERRRVLSRSLGQATSREGIEVAEPARLAEMSAALFDSCLLVWPVGRLGVAGNVKAFDVIVVEFDVRRVEVVLELFEGVGSEDDGRDTGPAA
jgi:hypothetical protein